MADVLETEKSFLVSHQKELAEEHPGKFLLLKGNQVFGAFETYEQGVIEGTTKFGAGPFLVRSVNATSDADAPSIPALSVGMRLVGGS